MIVSIAMLVDNKGVKSFQDFRSFGRAVAFVRESRARSDIVAGVALSSSGGRWSFGSLSVSFDSDAQAFEPVIVAKKDGRKKDGRKEEQAQVNTEELEISDLLDEIENA